MRAWGQRVEVHNFITLAYGWPFLTSTGNNGQRYFCHSKAFQKLSFEGFILKWFGFKMVVNSCESLLPSGHVVEADKVQERETRYSLQCSPLVQDFLPPLRAYGELILPPCHLFPPSTLGEKQNQKRTEAMALETVSKRVVLFIYFLNDDSSN